MGTLATCFLYGIHTEESFDTGELEAYPDPNHMCVHWVLGPSTATAATLASHGLLGPTHLTICRRLANNRILSEKVTSSHTGISRLEGPARANGVRPLPPAALAASASSIFRAFSSIAALASSCTHRRSQQPPPIPPCSPVERPLWCVCWEGGVCVSALGRVGTLVPYQQGGGGASAHANTSREG
jgi:hypothetical protein